MVERQKERKGKDAWVHCICVKNPHIGALFVICFLLASFLPTTPNPTSTQKNHPTLPYHHRNSTCLDNNTITTIHSPPPRSKLRWAVSLLGRPEEFHATGGERLAAERQRGEGPELCPGLDGAVFWVCWCDSCCGEEGLVWCVLRMRASVCTCERGLVGLAVWGPQWHPPTRKTQTPRTHLMVLPMICASVRSATGRPERMC